jgi:hypothetical protein
MVTLVETRVKLLCCVFDFFPLYFFVCVYFRTSAAPQRPAHGIVPSQVGTHQGIERFYHGLERNRT